MLAILICATLMSQSVLPAYAADTQKDTLVQEEQNKTQNTGKSEADKSSTPDQDIVDEEKDNVTISENSKEIQYPYDQTEAEEKNDADQKKTASEDPMTSKKTDGMKPEDTEKDPISSDQKSEQKEEGYDYNKEVSEFKNEIRQYKEGNLENLLEELHLSGYFLDTFSGAMTADPEMMKDFLGNLSKTENTLLTQLVKYELVLYCKELLNEENIYYISLKPEEKTARTIQVLESIYTVFMGEREEVSVETEKALAQLLSGSKDIQDLNDYEEILKMEKTVPVEKILKAEEEILSETTKEATARFEILKELVFEVCKLSMEKNPESESKEEKKEGSKDDLEKGSDDKKTEKADQDQKDSEIIILSVENYQKGKPYKEIKLKKAEKEKLELPKTLSVKVKDQEKVVDIPVKWISDLEFLKTENEEYIFYPDFDKKYSLDTQLKKEFDAKNIFIKVLVTDEKVAAKETMQRSARAGATGSWDAKSTADLQNIMGYLNGNTYSAAYIYIRGNFSINQAVSIPKGKSVYISVPTSSATQTITRAANASYGFFIVPAGATLGLNVAPSGTTTGKLVLDGGKTASRVAIQPLIVNDGSTTIRTRTTLRNNYNINNGDNTGYETAGGAILTRGTLSVDGATFSNNFSVHGGAIYTYPGSTTTVSNSTFTGNGNYVPDGYKPTAHAGTELLYHPNGGAIFNFSNLTITKSSFTSNTSYTSGGAIENFSASSKNHLKISEASSFTSNTAQGKTGQGGGAIHNVGNLTLSGSSISKNTATVSLGGGILSAPGYVKATSISDCTISENKATGNEGSGGGLAMWTGTTLSLKNTTITKNSAGNIAGGVLLWQTATHTITGSTISSNTAGKDGGGLVLAGISLKLSDGKITGNSAKNNAGGIFLTTSTLNLAGSEVSKNSATNAGGGIATWAKSTVNFTSGKIDGNSAKSGGGVYVNGNKDLKEGSTLKVNASATNTNSIGTNTATGNGGGIYIEEGNMASITKGNISGNKSGNYGGGIYNPSTGALTISGSSIASNTAANVGGGILTNGNATISDTSVNSNTTTSSDGAGIYINNKTLTITDSNINSNVAAGSGGGIGSYLATVNLTGTTLKGNTATANHGGAGRFWGGTTSIDNCNISSNKAGKLGGGFITYGGEAGKNTTTLKNSSVSGNSATTGKGIYIQNYGALNMLGSSNVNANNDIYLESTSFVNITGALTSAGTVAKITPNTYTNGRTVARVAYGTKLGSLQYQKLTLTPSGTYLLRPADYQDAAAKTAKSDIVISSKYTVTYEKNTAREVNDLPGATDKYWYEGIKLSKLKPNYERSNFLGWDTNSKVTKNPKYQPGAAFTENKNTVLYAIWKPNTPPTIKAEDIYVHENDPETPINQELLLDKTEAEDEEDGVITDRIIVTNLDAVLEEALKEVTEEERNKGERIVEIQYSVTDLDGAIATTTANLHIVLEVFDGDVKKIRFISEEYIDTLNSASWWYQISDWKQILQETLKTDGTDAPWEEIES